MNIISQPINNGIYFIESPVILEVQETTSTFIKFILAIKYENEEPIEFDYKRDANNKCKIDMQYILQSVFKLDRLPEIANLNNEISIMPNFIKKVIWSIEPVFSNGAGQSQGGNILMFLGSNSKQATSQQLTPLDNYYTLTTRKKIQCMRNEKIVLTTNPFTQNSEFWVYITAPNFEALVRNIFSPLFEKNKPFIFCFTFQNLLQNVGNSASLKNFKMGIGSETTYVNEIEYEFIDEKPITGTFVFLNQFGAWESITATGKRSERTTNIKSIAKIPEVFAKYGEDERIFNVQAEKNITVAFGLYASKNMQFLREFINSKSVYELTDTGLIPVIIDTKELQEYANDNKYSELVIRYHYAQNQLNTNIFPIR